MGGKDIAESNGESVAVISPVGEVDTAPAEAAGVMPTESIEIITDEAPQVTGLSAEEELTALPASDETAADAEEDRDKAKDE